MALVLLYLTLSTAAAVSIHPNKLQFFHYDRFSLSCESDWTIRRNTSTKTSQSCSGFGAGNGTSCILKDVYPSDTGRYWCESKGGKERSNIISITVTTGSVILESPARPVTEGENVTLHCFYKGRYESKVTSDFSATFFRGGVFIGKEPDGKMILPAVTKSNEGLYTCKHPTGGESAQSLLTVTDPVKTMPQTLTTVHEAAPPIPFNVLLCVILVFILYTGIIIVCVYAYQRYTKARAKAESVIYDHLIIIES